MDAERLERLARTMVSDETTQTQLLAYFRRLDSQVGEFDEQAYLGFAADWLAGWTAAIDRCRSLHLDKPEDRLYHASDNTWWRREGDNLVAASPPDRVSKNLAMAWSAWLEQIMFQWEDAEEGSVIKEALGDILRRVAEAFQKQEGKQSPEPQSLRLVDYRSAIPIINLLAEVASLPVPSTVPTSLGGIQIEWHQQGNDLEIEATPEGDMSYYYSTIQGHEEEGQITVDRLIQIWSLR